MSQRINISVPEELYQKMQTFKEKLNISKVCQDAIQSAVSIEEVRSQVGDDIEKLAVAFKRERDEYGRMFREEGFKDGTNDAFKLRYQELYTIWLCQDSPPKDVFRMGVSKETSRKLERGVPFSDFIDSEDADDFYYAAYVEGLLDVWKRVCKKLSIHGFEEEKEVPNGDEHSQRD